MGHEEHEQIKKEIEPVIYRASRIRLAMDIAEEHRDIFSPEVYEEMMSAYRAKSKELHEIIRGYIHEAEANLRGPVGWDQKQPEKVV